MENQEIEKRRHSAAHLMARAISNVFEDVQVDIGPATDDGFYYDFDLPHRISTDDFPKIEAEIARLIALDEPFVRKEVSREECEKLLLSLSPTVMDEMQMNFEEAFIHDIEKEGEDEQ